MLDTKVPRTIQKDCGLLLNAEDYVKTIAFSDSKIAGAVYLEQLEGKFKKFNARTKLEGIRVSSTHLSSINLEAMRLGEYPKVGGVYKSGETQRLLEYYAFRDLEKDNNRSWLQFERAFENILLNYIQSDKGQTPTINPKDFENIIFRCVQGKGFYFNSEGNWVSEPLEILTKNGIHFCSGVAAVLENTRKLSKVPMVSANTFSGLIHAPMTSVITHLDYGDTVQNLLEIADFIRVIKPEVLNTYGDPTCGPKALKSIFIRKPRVDIIQEIGSTRENFDTIIVTLFLSPKSKEYILQTVRNNKSDIVKLIWNALSENKRFAKMGVSPTQLKISKLEYNNSTLDCTVRWKE